MAFSSSSLHLAGVAGGYKIYTYVTTDSLADVLVASYVTFPGLVANDRIHVVASDGNMWVKVSSVDANGVATLHFAGGDLPVNTAVGTASGSVLIGYTEKNSGTASAHVLPDPYPGARVTVFKTGTATAGQTFVTSATTVTLNTHGDRTIQLNWEGEGFTLRGSSTTRWRIEQLVSFASAGGANVYTT